MSIRNAVCMDQIREIKAELEKIDEEVDMNTQIDAMTKVYISTISWMAICTRKWPSVISTELSSLLEDEGWPEALVAEDDR